MIRKEGAIVIAVCLLLAVPLAEAAQRDHRRGPQNAPVKVLPRAHHQLTLGGKSYFYASGRFYRHANGVYSVVAAPIGAIVPILPGGYLGFGVGSNRYFYFQGIYYRRVDSGYEVIEEPVEAVDVLAAGSDKLIAYPAAGQSSEQSDRDRYECHVWASTETDYDPTDSDADHILAADYKRAITACLEARNYVVK